MESEPIKLIHHPDLTKYISVRNPTTQGDIGIISVLDGDIVVSGGQEIMNAVDAVLENYPSDRDIESMFGYLCWAFRMYNAHRALTQTIPLGQQHGIV